jgi:asparagine synthase (glutamine-hydrolysing)
MSGLLAVTGGVSTQRLESGLGRLAFLGGDEAQFWSEDGTMVAVTRKGWELGEDFSGRVLVLERPDLVVVADAVLYDRGGLTRALASAGVSPGGTTVTHLIEAAYRAWGNALVDHLYGDYAFVVWDRRHRRLLAARDPVGLRPLFYARTPEGAAVASSARAVAELVGRADDLNLACLGSQVSGLMWSSGMDTAFNGVDPVPAGHRLTWEDGRLGLERFWHPPVAPDRHPVDAGEAAVELQALLGRAVTERMGAGVNTVWMSGGWDSTAVFAAGQHALAPAERHQLRPVSISYPAGDPGCEDDLIQQVADRWSADVHWLRSDDIPLLDGLEERAGLSDEPPAHLYELWNRALAQGTRSVGARIALDGCGGDNFFAVSDIARARAAWGWRHLARASVLPLLPDSVVRAGERVAGRRLPRHYMERPLMAWMRPDFVARAALRERDLANLNAARGRSLAQTENMLYATLPIWGWGASFMYGALLQEGVDVRHPLLDLRVIEFALSRPVTERSDGMETKKLLRRSMQGLLPEGVLAPRQRRTGMTTGFSRQRMTEAYPALLDRLFAEPLRLAELGMVDPAALRLAARTWQARGDEWTPVGLFHAMKVEFWLRGRNRAPASRSASPRRASALSVSSAA